MKPYIGKRSIPSKETNVREKPYIGKRHSSSSWNHTSYTQLDATVDLIAELCGNDVNEEGNQAK